MPKKPPAERWRYIAFRIDSVRTFSRGEFLNALLSVSRKGKLGDSFRITVFERDSGILRVPHLMKDEAIRTLTMLSSIEQTPCTVTTLKTSGTIKTLKTKYFRERAEGPGQWL